MAKRSNLQPGQVIYVPSGHAISAHSVSFYAQDNEQSGLLARAQEIENLDKSSKAQIFIADEARNTLVRAEAAYSESSQRLVSIRAKPPAAQAAAHELQVETLRLSQLAEQTRARSEQISGDLSARSKRNWPTCKSAVPPQKRALKSWTCNWPTAKSAMPNSTKR